MKDRLRYHPEAAGIGDVRLEPHALGNQAHPSAVRACLERQWRRPVLRGEEFRKPVSLVVSRRAETLLEHDLAHCVRGDHRARFEVGRAS